MRLESLPANSGTFVTFPKLGQGHLHKVSVYSHVITGLKQIRSGGGGGGGGEEEPFINDVIAQPQVERGGGLAKR